MSIKWIFLLRHSSQIQSDNSWFSIRPSYSCRKVHCVARKCHVCGDVHIETAIQYERVHALAKMVHFGRQNSMPGQSFCFPGSCMSSTSIRPLYLYLRSWLLMPSNPPLWTYISSLPNSGLWTRRSGRKWRSKIVQEGAPYKRSSTRSFSSLIRVNVSRIMGFGSPKVE